MSTQFPSKSEEKLKLAVARKKKRKAAAANAQNNKDPYEFVNEYIKSSELIILQSKKDIVQTPSENSYRVAQSESFAENGELKMQRKISEIINYNMRRTSISNSAQKTASNDRNINHVIEMISNHEIDVSGVVEEICNVKESVKTLMNEENYFATDNNNMVTYFVDVLNDPANVFNAKPESPEPPETNELETEENPTQRQKITINDMIEIDRYDDELDRASPNDFYVDANEYYDSDATDVIESNPSPIISSHYIPTPEWRPIAMQSSSFDYKPKPKLKKFRRTRKSLKDKEKEKRIIMDLMIEQLSIPSKEPKTLFEALKLMAKAKQKCIRFADTTGDIESEEECGNECQLWDQHEQFSEFY